MKKSFQHKSSSLFIASMAGVALSVCASSAFAAGSDHAFERPLGPAGESLLDGLRAHAGVSGGIAPVSFGELWPLFEQTAEQLERTAGEKGWLRLETRSVSIVWTIARPAHAAAPKALRRRSRRKSPSVT